MVAIFILLQRGDLRDRMIRLVGSRDLHRTTTAMDEAARRLSRYFVAQLSMNAGRRRRDRARPRRDRAARCTAVRRARGAAALVPYIGSWLAVGTAILLAAAVQPNWTMMVWTLVLFGFVEILASQVIEPVLYGHSSGLSPFAVIVAAIFWSWIWGPIGLILSTPLTLCLVILGRHVDRLQFLEVLFGDRPALTPDENFYQRILAGDPDEALSQAEVLLRDNSLTAYYDEGSRSRGCVSLTTSMGRGVVTALQLQRIKQATLDLVEGLEDVEDPRIPMPRADADHDADHDADAGESGSAMQTVLPERLEGPAQAAPTLEAAAGGRVPVLCISGRGELDDLMAVIAVQLLGKHGLEVRHCEIRVVRARRACGRTARARAARLHRVRSMPSTCRSICATWCGASSSACRARPSCSASAANGPAPPPGVIASIGDLGTANLVATLHDMTEVWRARG
ncbi:MAG: AI-2E family transporter [Pararobbsia sp.]